MGRCNRFYFCAPAHALVMGCHNAALQAGKQFVSLGRCHSNRGFLIFHKICLHGIAFYQQFYRFQVVLPFQLDMLQHSFPVLVQPFRIRHAVPAV